MSLFKKVGLENGLNLCLNNSNSIFKDAAYQPAIKESKKQSSENNYVDIQIDDNSPNISTQNNTSNVSSKSKADNNTFYPTQSKKNVNWKTEPLDEKEVEEVKYEYIHTPGLTYAARLDKNGNTVPASYQKITKYTDGTTKVEIYDYDKLTSVTVNRYSGDPDNPQDGDVRIVENTLYNKDGTYKTSDTEYKRATFEPDNESYWITNTVFSYLHHRSFEADGTEVSFYENEDRWREIQQGDGVELPRGGEKRADGSYEPYKDVEYKE